MGVRRLFEAWGYFTFCGKKWWCDEEGSLSSALARRSHRLTMSSIQLRCVCHQGTDTPIPIGIRLNQDQMDWDQTEAVFAAIIGVPLEAAQARLPSEPSEPHMESSEATYPLLLLTRYGMCHG